VAMAKNALLEKTSTLFPSLSKMADAAGSSNLPTMLRLEYKIYENTDDLTLPILGGIYMGIGWFRMLYPYPRLR